MIHDENNALTRREVIRGPGAITIASLVASASGIEGVTPAAQNKSASKDSAPLGQRIRGFQHFGMTVQNMDRAFAFYTEILGGTEIMQDGDFHGEKIHNTLMLNDEIEAIEQKISPVTIGFRTCVAGNNDWTSASYSSTTWSSSCSTIARVPSQQEAVPPGHLRTTVEAPRIQGRYTSVFICVTTSTSTNSCVISKPSLRDVE